MDLDTASASLLTHVAGSTTALAKNIVAYRDENGAPPRAAQKGAELGPKAFEQCAGFLRVQGKTVLDATAVHPKATPRRKALMKAGLCAAALQTRRIVGTRRHGAEQAGMAKLAVSWAWAEPTLGYRFRTGKAGRDPRDELPAPVLRTDVLSMEDLKPGMELTGTVRNVIDFGAFVDIGVHQDGLVHISRWRTSLSATRARWCASATW